MTKSSTPDILKFLPAKSPALMKEFAKKLIDKIPEDDLKHAKPEAVSATLQVHWDLFKSKKPGGKPVIKIYTPPLKRMAGALAAP